jgi:allophanate hydrolase
MIRVLKPGLQTTVQAGPRRGQRHLGVPASGAADPLALALANRLVGNALLAPALETTLTGVKLRFEGSAFVAVTGARAAVRLNGERVKRHTTLAIAGGDELEVGSAKQGARNYVAIAGGIAVDDVLGSASTYLPAGFGGFRGRALNAGDLLPLRPVDPPPPMLRTPKAFRPRASSSLAQGRARCRTSVTTILKSVQRLRWVQSSSGSSRIAWPFPRTSLVPRSGGSAAHARPVMPNSTSMPCS